MFISHQNLQLPKVPCSDAMPYNLLAINDSILYSIPRSCVYLFCFIYLRFHCAEKLDYSRLSTPRT